MALVIPSDHYQCLIPFKHNAHLRPAAITMGIRVAPGVENPVDVCDDVLLALSSAFRNLLDDDVTVGPVVATFDQGGGARGSVTGVSSFVGGADRNSVGPNTALLLRKQTARVGRPGRGRIFMPWAIDNLAVNEVGILNNATVTGLQAAADAFLTSLDTQRPGTEMVILHDEGVPGGTTPSLVTRLLVDPRVGTQRRRNR